MNRSLPFAAALFLLFLASCSSGSSGDWADIPDYLDDVVVIYGDSRTGHDVHRWLMEGMASLAPTAVFHTGDLVEDGTIQENWDIFNNIASQLPAATPIYPALGNHEKESALYFENFDLPGNERWYRVDDIENFHFIVLDTESNLAAGSTQYQWLADNLSAGIPAEDYTLVVFHYPLFSTGYHGSDEKGVAGDLVPLFEEYGVDAVFNGHDHDYERSTVNGVRYIVTGGGGGPLRGQYSSSEYSDLFASVYHFCVLYFDDVGDLTVDVWDQKVNLIDRFVIANR
jgi:3',5'-cyclic AMP phosphodiesterase CpdA